MLLAPVSMLLAPVSIRLMEANAVIIRLLASVSIKLTFSII